MKAPYKLEREMWLGSFGFSFFAVCGFVCLFWSVCKYCGKDSSGSCLSKPHHMPGPLPLGAGIVPVPRRLAVAKNVL